VKTGTLTHFKRQPSFLLVGAPHGSRGVEKMANTTIGPRDRGHTGSSWVKVNQERLLPTELQETLPGGWK
jgi:hypothetical protein